MDIEQIKNLISRLENSGSTIPSDIRQAFIDHASEKLVLNEFSNVLRIGNQETKIKLVEILSDIYSQESFELLMYALHDHFPTVSRRVVEKLTQWRESDISSVFDEHKRNNQRKSFFLPLITDYLDKNKDMDLNVRGKLLDILAHYKLLNDVDSLIDAMRYGNFETREVAIDSLAKILHDDTRKKIRWAISEALQGEYHPDIRPLLQRALNPTDEDSVKNVFSVIQSSENWFDQAVLYFRELGFYQQYARMSNDELVEKIKVLRGYEPGDTLTYNTNLLLILAEDKQRVWYCDAESYYDQRYVEFFKIWGDISCGTFTPENIAESRDEALWQIRIIFQYKGQPMKIIAENYGDWVDLEIFIQINEILRGSEVQFCNIMTNTQEACIVTLTELQKMRLEKDLGLKIEFSGRYIPPPIF